MEFDFLPDEIRAALNLVDGDKLTEIRLRSGQAVIVGTTEKYCYLGRKGCTDDRELAIVLDDAEIVLSAAMEGSVFAYTEQLRHSFITLDGGARIGVAGEYVTERGEITAIKNVTSLNIRIPHDIYGCSQGILENIRLPSDVIIFSRPGLGKTTLLRDIARSISSAGYNVLVCDERSEISGGGRAFDLGCRTDAVRGADKLSCFGNAIRAMRPDFILTDELYGERDRLAIECAARCGINFIASTHVSKQSDLAAFRADYYAELCAIGGEAIVYDKDFNIICHCSTVGTSGNIAVRPKKGKGEDLFGILRVQ